MSHMKKPRTHEENRSVLCGLCFKKGDLRKITAEQLSQLCVLVYSEYNLNNPKFQLVLCRGCALALSENSKKKEKYGRKLLRPVYSNMRQPPAHMTRSSEDVCCPCTVC